MRPKGTLQKYMAVPDRCQHMSCDQHTYCLQLHFHQHNHTPGTAADHCFGVAVLTSGSTGIFSTDWIPKQVSPCPYREVLSLLCSGATTSGKLPQTEYRVILGIKQLARPQCSWIVLSSTKGITTDSTRYAASYQKHGRGIVLDLSKITLFGRERPFVKKIRVFCMCTKSWKEIIYNSAFCKNEANMHEKHDPEEPMMWNNENSCNA